MAQNTEPFDLSEYKVISIEDRHKVAIVHLVNSIISEQPLLDDLKDVQNAVWRLGRLISFFERAFLCGQNIKIPMVVTEHNLPDISSNIRNWLYVYYNCDSVIESLKLEDGNEEEIAMAALLILNVFYQLRNSLSSVKAYFDLGWIYLAEFDEQLEAMWRSDRLVQFLQNELECVRNEWSVDKQKLLKTQKEITNVKSKLQQSKSTIERLRSKGGDKPGPKSKKKGRYEYESDVYVRKRGRPRKVPIIAKESDSDIESDTPPAPGTPVLLSSSGSGASCRYCGKWFNESFKLNRHMTIHSGLKPFSCDWPGCGRPFDSNYKLQRHRRCHTGERPFPCEICDKRFTRSDKLREHQRLHLKKKNEKVDNGEDLQIQKIVNEPNDTEEIDDVAEPNDNEEPTPETIVAVVDMIPVEQE